VKEQRDGRNASDVGGVAARDDAREKLKGQVGEGAVRGGGGGASRLGGLSQEKEFTEGGKEPEIDN